ncbi:MAG: thioredoxin family protein [Anaeroplasmataceae bacterium]
MIQEYNENTQIRGLMVLFFYASWSKSCALNEEIISIISKKINVLKINTTKYYDLKIKYNVKKIPTYILSRDGNIISIYSGPINRKNVLGWLEQMR